MDRRSFLKATGVTAATAGTPAALHVGSAAQEPMPSTAPAKVSGTREFVLAIPWPDSPAGPADHVLRLARRLETALDGRWRITPCAAPQGGFEAGMTAGADIYAGSACNNSTFHPAFAFFAGLPGAGTLNPDGFVAWLKVGGGQQLWDDLAAEFDIKPFLAGHLGRWPGLWTKRPIDCLADLAGCRIAAEGLARDVVRGIGAEPVALAPSKLASALAADEIAAAEYGGAATSLALGLPEAARHLAGFGIQENGIALSFGMRRSVWERLSDGERIVVEAVLADANETMLAEQRATEKPLRDMLRQRYRVTCRPFPAEVAITIDRVSEAVVAHLAGGDAMAARINRSYHSFRNAAWGLAAADLPHA